MEQVARSGSNGKLIRTAVGNSRRLSRDWLAERLFSLAFSGLVYPQIWEDPIVDLEALALTPESRIVTIASGGCNLLSYLTAAPESIVAVDLNRAHIALNRLKLAAAREIDAYDDFFRFFGDADTRTNINLFDARLAAKLDPETRRFWSGRNWTGRRRINAFADNLYTKGLLGRFIGLGHLLARAHGVDIRALMAANSLEEQRDIFNRDIAPLFDRPFVRWLMHKPSSLYGLGIPPAQYRALAADGENGIAGVLRERLEKLACDFPLRENYFARQAFNRSYGGADSGRLPPYLERDNFALMRAHAGRASVHHINYTDYLRLQPEASLDRYILLDAQDWMNDDKLNQLWREITRTARPQARVIFRTSASPSLLPGRLDDVLLARWSYEQETSQRLTRQDRSAIYGGFHLYTLKG